MSDEGERPVGRRKSRSRDGRGHARAALLALLPLSLAAALLVLTVPRAIASWTAFGARPIIEKIKAGVSPTTAEFETCAKALERAAAWHISSEATPFRSYCELAVAIAAPAGSTAKATWTEKAEMHLVEALLANPADGASWINLAAIRSSRGAPGRQVLSPLLASIDVAPNSRQLWPARTELLMRYWVNLSVEEIIAARQQIRAIWSDSESRNMMFATAVRFQRLPELTWALSKDEQAMAELARIRGEALKK